MENDQLKLFSCTLLVFASISSPIRNQCRSAPAPLSLCLIGDSDIIHDARLCPFEINVLRKFFLSAKWIEWTKSKWWLDEYKSHCNWLGVTCDEEEKTRELRLQNNALSATLNPNISLLSLLEVLDLSDNDIKVHTASLPLYARCLLHFYLIILSARQSPF